MKAYLIRVYSGTWHGEIETDGSLQSMYEVWCDNGKSLFGGKYEHVLLYVGALG